MDSVIRPPLQPGHHLQKAEQFAVKEGDTIVVDYGPGTYRVVADGIGIVKELKIGGRTIPIRDCTFTSYASADGKRLIFLIYLPIIILPDQKGIQV